MKHLLLAASIPFLLMSSAPAIAFNSNSNRQIIPLGESEAFMANTGVGRATDTGAVYYNPASLAEMSAGRVSVTSSVYLSFNTKTDALIHFDNTNVGFQASGFNTIPAFYVAAYKLGDWFGALSILVPDSIQVDNRAPFTTPNTSSNIVQSQRSSDLWLGLTLARRLDERWSLGCSLFGIQHQETLSLGLDVQFPGAATSALATSLEQENLDSLGLSAVFGAAFAATDWFRLGLRFQTAFLQVYGQADTFQANHQVSGGSVTTSGEAKQGTSANYRMPFDMTVGTAFLVSDWFAFLADLSLQLGSTYSSIPGSVLNEDVSLTPTPRLNLGLELKPAQWLPVRAGFYYNPSANGGNAGTEGYIAENFLGFTAGVGLNSERVGTGVGFFYVWSSGSTTPIGAPGTVSSVSSHGVGGLLTASYIL
jgi:hypothetical protein